MVTCAVSGARVTLEGGVPGKARLAPNISDSSNVVSSMRRIEATVLVTVNSIPASHCSQRCLHACSYMRRAALFFVYNYI